MQEILPPFSKQMAGSGNSLRKVAHDTYSMLDYRNSVQIMYIINPALKMKLLAMYITPSIFMNMQLNSASAPGFTCKLKAIR